MLRRSIALLIVMFAFSACAGEVPSSDETSAPAETTVSAETTAEPVTTTTGLVAEPVPFFLPPETAASGMTAVPETPASWPIGLTNNQSAALFAEAEEAWSWFCGDRSGLELASAPQGEYARVIDSRLGGTLTGLHDYLRRLFTAEQVEAMLSICAGEQPVFRDVDGQLYMLAREGAGACYSAPQFTAVKVNEDNYLLEVRARYNDPCGHPGVDREHLLLSALVREEGRWVFSSFRGLVLPEQSTVALSACASWSEIIDYAGRMWDKLLVPPGDRFSVTVSDAADAVAELSVLVGDEGRHYLFLDSVTAYGHTLTFAEPMQLIGNWGFEFFVADGVLVIGQTGYGYGAFTLMTPDGIFTGARDRAVTGDTLSLFRGEDGSLRYRLHTVRPHPADLEQDGFAVVHAVLSPDDFLRETGRAAVIDGTLVLTPEERLTIGEVYDLEAELAAYNAEMLAYGHPEWCVEDLDALYARNRAWRNG